MTIQLLLLLQFFFSKFMQLVTFCFKGAVRFGTFKSIDFKKYWYVKVPVVPRSLML